MTNYKKPSLKELRSRAVSDLNTALKGADANLRNRVLNVFATILAGVGDEVLRYAAYISKQIFIQDADEEHLIKHGQEKRVPRKMASKASGPVSTKGVVGAVILSGTSVKRADGATYKTTEEAVISASGTCTIQIQADNAGAFSNATAGTIINFISPVSGVEAQGSVGDLGITGGSDIEHIEKYRERLLFVVQNPPTGGNETDYIVWAKEVPGVTRAWCYPKEAGKGTVTTRFMMDDIYGDGIPEEADVNRVKEHIATYEPATAVVFVEAPIAYKINFVFASLSPSTTEAKKAIEDNLKSLVQSSSIKPGGELKLSKIKAAISNATGNDDFELTSPSSNIIMPTGHITTMGTVTYPEPTNE